MKSRTCTFNCFEITRLSILSLIENLSLNPYHFLATSTIHIRMFGTGDGGNYSLTESFLPVFISITINLSCHSFVFRFKIYITSWKHSQKSQTYKSIKTCSVTSGPWSIKASRWWQMKRWRQHFHKVRLIMFSWAGWD